jgi:hypothetical protein
VLLVVSVSPGHAAEVGGASSSGGSRAPGAQGAMDEAMPFGRILFVVDDPHDPNDGFVERIRAEVAALGFVVVERTRVGPLEDDARRERAVAAIHILPSRRGVEVWMADETSGRSLLRQVIVDERTDGPDQGVVALQTAELLRTSLLSKPVKMQPEMPKQPDPSTKAIAVVPSARRFAETGLQAGLGTLYSPGGAAPALQVWLSLRQHWGKRLGLALDFSGPVRRASISGPEGTADLGAWLAGLEVFARFLPSESRWNLNAGVGASYVRITSDGYAVVPLQGVSSHVSTGAGYARIDAGWAHAGWYRLGFAALAGATFEHLTVRFADNDAGTWGWMLLAALLTAEVDWR